MEVSFEMIERKQFKHQSTINKVAFNNSHNNTMVLDRDHHELQMKGGGGERCKQQERCETGCSWEQHGTKTTVVNHKTISIHDNQTHSPNIQVSER
jgi:hypothetical protein